METIFLCIATLVFVCWLIWIITYQKPNKKIERIADASLKKNWEHYGRDKKNTSSDRIIPKVPASERINLNNDTIDSYLYAQQPYVASDDYPKNELSPSFNEGFGGGSFSGGGAGGSWESSSDSSSSYDSGSSSDTSSYSND